VAPEPLQETPGAFGLPPYNLRASGPGVGSSERLWQQHRDQVDAFLGETGISYEFAGVAGQPAGEIVEVADRSNADLIVVGTREPGFVERLLEGSVSQGVARRAHCDVLIVHPPKDEAPG
jgi:nucleotide-binding universal stress UspA family protein